MKWALISSLTGIIVNFSICSKISVYIYSNFVFHLIHFHTAVLHMSVLFSFFKFIVSLDIE